MYTTTSVTKRTPQPAEPSNTKFSLNPFVVFAGEAHGRMTAPTVSTCATHAVKKSSGSIATRHGLTVRGSNPGRGEIFRTRPDRPWGPPSSLLYNGYRVFPGGKAAGAWR